MYFIFSHWGDKVASKSGSCLSLGGLMLVIENIVGEAHFD